MKYVYTNKINRDVVISEDIELSIGTETGTNDSDWDCDVILRVADYKNIMERIEALEGGSV